MNLESIPIPDNLFDLIERTVLEGYPVIPYQAVKCPCCSHPAIIIDKYLGGFGKHHAWRCLDNRDHQGPAIRVYGNWLMGQYLQRQFTYEIVPATIISHIPAPVSITG